MTSTSRRTRKGVEPSASIELTDLLRNPFVRPVIEYAIWAVAFWIASIIHQQPIYYLALILFFVRDLENVSERRRGLFRDFIAASMTSFLGWLFNDTLSWGLGFVLALVAGVILAQQIGDEIKQRVDAWLDS